MIEWIIQNEAGLRLGSFLGLLMVMMLWEWRKPARTLQQPRWLRWSSNLGIVVINTAVLRFFIPLLAVGTALWVTEKGIGLFNRIDWPLWLEILLTYLILDMAIYFQHVLVHYVPLFWRFHRMHHADLDFDTTTGLRFHPVEIIFSMLIKMALVAAIGAPAVGVIIFEIILSAGAVFNHSNVRLPTVIEPWVRALIVTPDMHRVHHSVIRRETNSNFGFSLSIWDRVFGTYIKQPQAGHTNMTIGIEVFRDSKDLYLHRMLIQPLSNPVLKKADPE